MPDFPRRELITPGQPISVIRSGAGGSREMGLVRWGFVPAWAKEMPSGKPLVNARSETVFEKPSFRHAIKRRRCLVPADGFYEWFGDEQGRKQAYFIHRPDDALFAFAGIWEHWLGNDGSEIETAAILTTHANQALEAFYHRMPVIIQPADYQEWLDVSDEANRRIDRFFKPVGNEYFTMQPSELGRKKPAPKPVEEEPQLRLF